MILRPPKNYNEYSVSVPMSIDWMLKTLQKVVKGENVVTKITAGTNITISPVGGTGQVTINASVPATPTLAQVTTAGNTTTNAITVDKLTVSTGTTKGVTLGGTSIYEITNQPTYTQLGISPSSGNKSPVFLFYPSGTATASVMEFYHKSTLGTNERVIFKNDNGLLQLGGDAANIPIEFIGAGIARMKIFANGNVAINTTTDAGYKLDVNGTARVSGNLTVDTNTLFVDATNHSVGIGTTSPLAKLHIATNTGGTNTVLRLSVAPSSANVIHFRDTDGTSQGAFLATGSTFSYGTYQAAQVNLAGGLGGIGLRTNNGNAHIRFYSGNADEDFSPEIARFVASTGNLLLNTTTDAGQKLQVSGKVFIKGTTSLTATKVFEVQNGAGESIMDFRDSTYAFFGCGQGGGSATGFIFNYSNTSYCQFSGYNYGAGAGAYKPILLDTDIVGRGNGVFVNFGVSTNPPPDSDTEFGVRGRTADTTSFIARFRNSSNTDMFEIRADGALFTNTLQGYSGTLSIPGNPPGSTTITITNGLITNIA